MGDLPLHEETNAQRLVVVTGFGPFGQHQINASWEAVRLLSKDTCLPKDTRLVLHEIPVVYQEVDQRVADIWQKQPMLVIHVGVSALAKQITLETTACGENYVRYDCEGKLPDNGKNCCSANSYTNISCKLNVGDICKQFNEKFDDVKACISTNAGRYLCEYTYYSSLSFNPARTLFIHVPDIDKPYSVQQTSKGLKAIVKMCVEQLDKCGNTLI